MGKRKMTEDGIDELAHGLAYFAAISVAVSAVRGQGADETFKLAQEIVDSMVRRLSMVYEFSAPEISRFHTKTIEDLEEALCEAATMMKLDISQITGEPN